MPQHGYAETPYCRYSIRTGNAMIEKLKTEEERTDDHNALIVLDDCGEIKVTENENGRSTITLSLDIGKQDKNEPIISIKNAGKLSQIYLDGRHFSIPSVPECKKFIRTPTCLLDTDSGGNLRSFSVSLKGVKRASSARERTNAVPCKKMKEKSTSSSSSKNERKNVVAYKNINSSTSSSSSSDSEAANAGENDPTDTIEKNEPTGSLEKNDPSDTLDSTMEQAQYIAKQLMKGRDINMEGDDEERSAVRNIEAETAQAGVRE